MASTSSSTVPATMVELDHWGTHAIVRARSTASRSAGVVSGHGQPGPGGARPGRGDAHGIRRGRGEEAGEGQQHGGLARPARPDEGGEAAGSGVERGGQLGGAEGPGRAVDELGRPLDDQRPGPEGSPRGGTGSRPGRDEGRVDGDRLGRPLPRHPDAHREQSLALGGQGRADRAVRDDAAVVGEHDEPLDEVDPRSEDVLDDDERRRGVAGGSRSPAPRRHPAPPAQRWGRASRSVRRGGRPTGRARGSRRARAVGSARPTAPRSGCRGRGRRARRPPGRRRRHRASQRAASRRSPARTRRPARWRPRPPRRPAPAARDRRCRGAPPARRRRRAPSRRAHRRRRSRAGRREPAGGWTCPTPRARRAARAPRPGGSG